jgi:hypothetical protein
MAEAISQTSDQQPSEPSQAQPDSLAIAWSPIWPELGPTKVEITDPLFDPKNPPGLVFGRMNGYMGEQLFTWGEDLFGTFEEARSICVTHIQGSILTLKTRETELYRSLVLVSKMIPPSEV